MTVRRARRLRAAVVCLWVATNAHSATATATRTVAVGPGEELSVTDEGAGDAVLLLPSLTFPGFGFRRVVPLLAAAGRRVLVIEPLGLGGSSQPEAADYSLGAQADRVGRALDALRSGPVVVVAQSAGVSTALRLAYHRPDLVQAILSLEGGIAEEAMTPGTRRAIRFAPLLKLFGGQRLIRGRVRKTLVERSSDPAWVTDDVVEAYLRPAGADFDAILRTYRLMARAHETERLRDRLTEIRCPVRLLLGGSPHPSGVPEEELAAMRSSLARFTVETVPRCGHFVAEEAPQAVAQAIESLLRQAPPPLPSARARSERGSDRNGGGRERRQAALGGARAARARREPAQIAEVQVGPERDVHRVPRGRGPVPSQLSQDGVAEAQRRWRLRLPKRRARRSLSAHGCSALGRDQGLRPLR